MKCNLLNGSHDIFIQILLTFVPKGQIKNIYAYVLAMIRHWIRDKPLPLSIMV